LQAGGCFRERHLSRGAAFGDLNNDGKLDVVVAHINEAPAILLNRSPTAGNWLLVKCIGRHCNRSAIGARVSLTTSGKQAMDEVRSAYSYASANDLRVHFGLDRAREGKVEVRWPCGRQQVVPAVKATHVSIPVATASSTAMSASFTCGKASHKRIWVQICRAM
jgi:hypothetical protein